MDSGYDEDLLINPFYKTFQSKGKQIYKNAADNRWTICIPRKGNTSRSHSNRQCFESHVLIPLDKAKNTFNTPNDKGVTINGSFIITTKGFNEIKSVKILFEETFFNEKDESYHVLCIDQPLVGNTSSHSETALPNLETLQNCIDFLWPGNGIKRTRNQINEFISLFNSTYSRIASESIRHSMDAANTLFTRAMQSCLKEPQLRRSASGNKAYMDSLKLSVETYVMNGISKRVFKGVSSFLAEQDAMFNKTTRNLSDIQLKDLQVNPVICKNIPKCKKLISNLNKFTTPLEKLYVLKLTIMAISENSKSKPDEEYAITSDDLLPALVFIIIKSEIPNWLANLSYMQNFHFSKVKNDELQFYLSSTEAALEHVRTGRLDSMISLTHTQRVKMIDTLLQGLDSNEKNIVPSPVDKFFEKIRTKNTEDVLKALDDSESNLGQLTESLCHPLCGCEKCKKLQASKQHEQSTVTVFSRDDVGCTALHQAAECGCEEIIYELVKKGAVVNAMNYHGTTPLHYACQRGHLKSLVILAHYKADVNAVDNSVNTPLHLAAANGHELCMEFLLSSDCEMHSDRKIQIDSVNEHGDTSLHIASRWGFAKIVFLLLRHNAASGIKNKTGKTPLQCALNEKIQEIFLQETNEYKDPVDLNSSIRSSFGDDAIKAGYVLPDSPTTTRRKKEFTNLLKAIADGNTDLVRQKLGISKEPDSPPGTVYPSVDYVNDLLCHPLCQCEKCAALQKKVVSEAVSINANTCNSEGVRPVHVASIHGFEDIVTILLRESDADPNVRTKENHRSPLHLACQYNKIECVSLLIKYGARVNLKDLNGNTALHFCCTNGHIGPAILLLQGGSNLHTSNQRGNTPLHDAVRWDYFDLAKLLLYYKAPMDVVNKLHLTPLQYARGSEVRMLLERAASEIEDGKESSDKSPNSLKTKGTMLFGDDMTVDELFSYEKSKERSKSNHGTCKDVEKSGLLSSDELFSDDLSKTIRHPTRVENCDENFQSDTDDLFGGKFVKDDDPSDSRMNFDDDDSSLQKEDKNTSCSSSGNKSDNQAIFEGTHDLFPRKGEDGSVSEQTQFDYEKYGNIDGGRRITVAQIFAAMESDEIDRLRMIADCINKFDRRSSLRSVETIDKSSAFLNRQFSKFDDVFEEPIPEISNESYESDEPSLPNYYCEDEDGNKIKKKVLTSTNNGNNQSLPYTRTRESNTTIKEQVSNAEVDTKTICSSSLASCSVQGYGTYTSFNTPEVFSRDIEEGGKVSSTSDDYITFRISELITEAISDTDVQLS